MKGIKKLLISLLVALMTVSNGAFKVLADEEPNTEELQDEQVEEPVEQGESEEVVDDHNFIYYLVDGTTIHFSNTQLENYNEFDTLTPKETKDEIPWNNSEINNVVIENEIKPTTMAHWFEDTKITEIDLSNLNTDNLINTNSLFKGCNLLEVIKVKNTFNLNNVDNSTLMFEGCVSLVGQNETTYDETKTDKEYAVIDTKEHVGYLTDADYIAEETQEESAETTPDETAETTPTNGDVYWGIKDNVFHLSNTEFGEDYTQKGKVEDYYDAAERDWNNESSTITSVSIDNAIVPSSTAYWFSGFVNASSITGLNKIDTSKVTKMESMFENCSQLTELDVSGFNTSVVKDMSSMFANCSNITYLDLTSFDTSKVTNMDRMFSTCSLLETIRVSENFVTTNVDSSSEMFYDCEKLYGGNGTGFYSDKTNKDYAKIDKGDDNPGYFTKYHKLKFDLNGQTGSVTPICKDVENGKAYGTLPTPTKEDYVFVGWFTDPTDGTEVTKDTLMEDKEVTVYAHWETYYYGLEPLGTSPETYKLHIGLNNYTYSINGIFNGVVTDRDSIPWIKYADQITAVSIDNEITPTTLAGWFTKLNIETIDLSNINFSNVFNMYGMFASCHKLKTVNFGTNPDTSNVWYMSYMFRDCTSLETIDLSMLTSDYLVETESMFNGCTSLKSVNFDNWDTKWLVYADAMFYNCTAIEELDLRSFVTSSLVNTSYMFYGCSNLKTIYATSKFDQDITDSVDMFTGCENLVGGYGTVYDSTKTKIEYARIDDGSTNKGYFTRYNKITFNDSGSKVSPSCTDVNVGSKIGKLPVLTKAGYSFLGWTKDTTGEAVTEDTIYDGAYNTLNASWEEQSETNTIYWGIKEEEVSGTNYTVLHLSNKDTFSSLSEGMHGSTDGIFTSADDVPWRNKSDIITYVKVDNVIIPQKTAYWFDGLSNVKLMDLSYLITNQVTDMSYMFNNCSSVVIIWVVETSFVLPEAITAETSVDMFNGCTNLKGGNGSTYSEFTTHNFTCARIDDTEKGLLTDGEYYNIVFNSNGGKEIFETKQLSQGLKLGYAFDSGELPSNVTRDGYKFIGWYTQPKGGEKVTADTKMKRSNITLYANWAVMYWGYDSANQTLHLNNSESGVSGYTNYGATDGVFASASDIPWYSFKDDIKKVVIDNEIAATQTNYWFLSLKNLKTIENLTNLNTEAVTDMSRMFAECSSLESLDLSGFNTQNVLDMSYMFYGCNSIETLDCSGFDTKDVYSMKMMFANMTNVKKINIKSFDDSTLISTEAMFQNDSSLETIKGPKTLEGWSEFTSDNMFAGCISLVGGNGTKYNSSKTDGTYAVQDLQDGETVGYFTKYNKLKYELNGTGSISQVCKDIPEGSMYGTLPDPSNSSVLFGGWFSDNSTFVNKVTSKTLMGDDDVTIYAKWSKINWGIDSDGVLHLSSKNDYSSLSQNGSTNGVFSASYSDWYYKNSNITKVVIEDEIVPLSTTNWFRGLNKLTAIEGLDKLDTSKTTGMGNMFNGCSLLTTIDLSNFNTSKVTDMHSMFNGCSGLTKLDLKGFDTSNVTNMNYMFVGCSKINSLDLSSFNTKVLSSAIAMFTSCSKLTEITLPDNFINEKTTGSLEQMFNGCANLKSLDLSTWNTSGISNMRYMFYNCTSLTTLKLGSNFKTDKVTNMTYMFANCSSITSLDLSNFNTENVTNMDYMLRETGGVKGSDIEKFNVSKLTSMESIFRDQKNITSLDLSNWDLSKVTNMHQAFAGCSNLNTIKFSGNQAYMNTELLTSTDRMFDGCTSLTKIENLSLLNTSNVTTMEAMFDNCSSLTSLDLSEFDTSKVTIMSNMFTNCSALTSIDLSSFNTSKVTNMKIMFMGCSNLKNINFGDNFDVSKVTDMSFMFSGCSSLENLDLSTFNTASATDMHRMFYNDSSLKTITFSDNFTTDKVTTMERMFCHCPSLLKLDLSSFTTDKLTDTSSMFKGDSSLTEIKTKTAFTTSNAITSDDFMFFGCSSLVGGNGTKYSGLFVDKTYARHDEGPDSSNPGYFTNSNNKTLTIDLNYSGSSKTTRNLASGTSYYSLLPTNPTRSNWIFDGWYDDPTAGNLITSSSTMPDVDTTVYAHWRTVYWGYKDGTLSLSSSDDFSATYETGKHGNTDASFASAEDIPWKEFKDLITKVEIKNSIKLIKASYLFANLSKVTTFEGMSKLDTSEVTNMYSMFEGDSSILELDISSLNVNNVKDVARMFNGLSSVKTIKAKSMTSATTSSDMFTGCVNLIGGTGMAYNSSKVTATYAHYNGGYFTQYNKLIYDENYTTKDITTSNKTYMDVEANTMGLDSKISAPTRTGYTFDGWYKEDGTKIDSTTPMPNEELRVYAKWNLIATGKNIWWKITEETISGSNIKALHLSNSNLGNYTDASTAVFGDSDTVPWLDTNVKYITIDNEISPTSTANWFKGMTGVKVIDLYNLTFKDTTDLHNMFKGCTSLTTIYAVEDDTVIKDSATTTDMFAECSENLVGGNGTTKWSTDKPTNKTYAKIGDKNTEGYFTDSNYYTLTIQYNNGTDSETQRLVQNKPFNYVDGDLPTNITKTGYIFDGWYRINETTGEHETVTNETIADRKNETIYANWVMFYWGIDNNKLVISSNKSDVSSYTHNGSTDGLFNKTDDIPWAEYTSTITSVEIKGTIKPFSTAYWFANLPNSTSITGLSNIDFTNTTDTSYMFYGSGFESIEITSSSISIKYMPGMFQKMSNLKNLNLQINTSNVSNMVGLFKNSDLLETIKVGSGFVTTKTTTDNSKGMFEGCSSLVGGNGTKYSSEHTDKEYAIYDKGKGYFTENRKVYYDANGGEGAPICVDVADTFGTLASATKENYSFQGWFTSATGGTKVSSGTLTTGINTIYAQWKGNTNKITLNDGYSETSGTTMYVTYGEAIADVSIPTRSTFRFKGYYEQKNCQGKKYFDETGKAVDDKWEETSDITLYAGWESKNSFTITFDSNGGSIVGSNTKTLIEDQQVGNTPDVKWKGHTFLGWYTQSSGGNLVDSTTLFTTDVTLYAHWKENNTHNITYELFGGTQTGNPDKYTEDVGVDGFYPATKQGFKFEGWYTGKEEDSPRITSIDADAKEDYKLYARYSFKLHADIDVPTTFKKSEAKDMLIHITDEAGALNLSYFKYIMIDGVKLKTTEFKEESGSIKLTVKKEKLAEMDEGKHEIRILIGKYEEGIKEVEFIVPFTVLPNDVDPPYNPPTKDESCEKVIGPTWHWNNSKGVCEETGVVHTDTK